MHISQHIFVQGKWSKELPFDHDSAQTLVLVLSRDPECANFIIKKFPKSCVLGCSSGGDIFGEQHFDHSTSVTVIRFSRSTLKPLSCDLSYENSFEAGKVIADGLTVRDKAAAILVLTPGLLKINGARFAEGLTSGLKDPVKLFGGIAGDPNITDTWTLDNAGIHPQKAVAIGFFGNNLIAEMATKSGASPLGIERTITKAKGNIVYEVDGKPVLSFYQQYLGEDLTDITKTLQFPLALSSQFDTNIGPLRTPQAVDLECQSVTFTESIPEGSVVRIMMASRENIVIGAEMASNYLKQVTGIYQADGHKFLLPISCVGRKYILGQSIEDEIEAIAGNFRTDKTFIHGFYSFGEFASKQDSSKICELHNQTLNLLMLFEKAAA